MEMIKQNHDDKMNNKRATYIIAEIAGAHEGNIDLAYRLIETSAEANADGIKFQIFHPDELAVKSYRSYDIYQKLFFTREQWEKLISYSKKNGLDVWIDPYDRWGLKVVNTFIDSIKGVKIPSTILSDLELVENILKLRCKKLLGISGFSISQIKRFFGDLGINRNSYIVLLYGFQKYPTKIEDLNLERIRTIKNEFKMPVGYADHVDGESVLAKTAPCLALVMGAEIIEKHITIDRHKKGLDYYSSLNPDEFKEMVKLIRYTEKAIGDGEIKDEEMEYLKDATKIVNNRKIEKGEIISKNKINYKRIDDDGNGLFPYQNYEVLGKIALNDIEKDTALKIEFVKKPKICALIAVRMKSKRLPNKALVDIEGYTAIERVVNNLKPSKYIDEIILATSTNKEDDPIEEHAKNKGLPFFRGDDDNVVKRFIDAAEKFNTDIVVRVTGDCPLVSYEIADYLINSHLEKGADYTGNKIDDTPIGTGSEVITLSALEKLTTINIDLNYSEYMTFYFRNNPEFFSINIVPCLNKYSRPNYRMTLDYPEDLEFFRVIYKKFQSGSGAIPLVKTIAFLDEHPEVVTINKNIPLKWKNDQKLIKKLENVTKIKNENFKVRK